MTERSRPYIGVSGVVDTEQQQNLSEIFNDCGLNQGRVLALGVKATHKTQYQDIENKYGKEWYPVGDTFSSVLRPDDSQLHVAQVFFDPDFVSDPVYRKKFIDKIHRRGKKWLTAVQFDMLPWHVDDSLPEFLHEVKSETGLKILLQAHSETMSTFNPRELARSIGKFACDLDYILLDSSHGKGVRLDIGKLQPYVDLLYESNDCEHMGIGIAGGLNSQNVMEDMPEIIRDYPDLSWDAEGQLHSTDVHGGQPIDMKKTKDYLVASSRVLKGV